LIVTYFLCLWTEKGRIFGTLLFSLHLNSSSISVDPTAAPISLDKICGSYRVQSLKSFGCSISTSKIGDSCGVRSLTSFGCPISTSKIGDSFGVRSLTSFGCSISTSKIGDSCGVRSLTSSWRRPLVVVLDVREVRRLSRAYMSLILTR
jgi:hypothetical protein